MVRKKVLTLPSRAQSRLWHDGSHTTLSLGCQDCPELTRCGGLSISAPIFSCLDFCRCKNRSKCDNVCRRNVTNFVYRIREISSFDLLETPRCPDLQVIRLPSVVPVLYNGYRRDKPASVEAVALPLFALFDKETGKAKVNSKAELASAYRFPLSARVIASGTTRDRRLEAWWKRDDRRGVIRALASIGVDLVTAPNFSIFTDVPRWDNFYNMKRIAL